jgi:hypothetical protein
MTLQEVNPDPIYQGADTTIPFTITDASGAPVELVHHAATLIWVMYTPRSGVVFTKTNGAGLTASTTVTGSVTAELAYADTAELLPIDYDHMLAMVLANKYSVEAFGTITILENVALL